MPVKLTSPYNFVPLNRMVLIPEWGNQISQDIPFSDSADGTICVAFKNITPLFIKNGMLDKGTDRRYIGDLTDGDQGFEDKFSAHVKKNGVRHYFLPATSIKGMIRSILEVMTFSKMECDNNVISRCIPDEHKKAEGIDMTKCILGYVDGEKALRGRVQFGNAFCDDYINDRDCREKKGILGQPQSGFYPYYLNQANAQGGYIKYTDNIKEISGRKFYRIHSGNSVSDLPGGSEKMESKLYPIPNGHLFFEKIHFHNLRPIEIGALLSALTFHKKSECFHNIGMAKGFGFGKLSIESISLSNLEFTADEYMQKFETYMSESVENWTSQNRHLFSIFSDHDDNDLKMPNREKYNEIEEQNDPDARLEEHSLFTVHEKYSEDYDAIRNLIVQNDEGKALNSIQTLKKNIEPLKDPLIGKMETQINLLKFKRIHSSEYFSIQNCINENKYEEASDFLEQLCGDLRDIQDPELNSLHEQITNGLAQMARNIIEKARMMVLQNNLEEAKDLLKSVDETKYKSLASEISDLKTLIDETEIKNSLDKVRSLIAQSEFDDARIELLKIKEEQQNEEIIDLQKQIENGLKKKAEQKKEAKVAAGLDFLGKIGYKISNFDKAKKQINDYLKKQGIQNIPNSEISKLKDFMNNMFVNKQQNNNHDKKRLEETSSDIWKTISSWIGDAAAKQLFGELKNQ